MKIKDFIVTPVTTCSMETNVGQARELMYLKDISAIPVISLNNKKAVIKGIVSYLDLAGVYDDNVSIQQVMTKEVHSVTPDMSAQEAAKIMLDKKIHHLVAIQDDNIVGIVSSLDFVKLVANSKI